MSRDAKIGVSVFGMIAHVATIPNVELRVREITRLLNLIVDDAIASCDAGDTCCEAFAERIRNQEYTYRGVSR